MNEVTPSRVRQVWLRDNAHAGAVVVATLTADFPSERLAEVEAAWAPWRARDPAAEHGHWDWRAKADPDLLRWLRLFAVERDGVQGLMAVLNRPAPSRLDAGAQLVYVSAVEAAPWNLPQFTDSPVYAGCGTQLLVAAIVMSEELGWGGRIGLHALARAESFYEHFGLTRVGPDAEYGRLVYYELAPEIAARLRSRFAT